MYMIEIRAERDTTNSDAYTRANYTLGTNAGDHLTFYLPADRCTWEQSDGTNGGYSIDHVYFYSGSTAGEGLTDGTGLGVPGSVEVTARIGYISKTGRFVGITT